MTKERVKLLEGLDFQWQDNEHNVVIVAVDGSNKPCCHELVTKLKTGQMPQQKIESVLCPKKFSDDDWIKKALDEICHGELWQNFDRQMVKWQFNTCQLGW